MTSKSHSGRTFWPTSSSLPKAFSSNKTIDLRGGKSYHWSMPPFYRKLLILFVFLFPLSAFGWLMTDNGPDPILVQVKQSIRLAPDLDAQLQDLAALEVGLGLTVADRWVNPQSFIELVRFPADFTEDQIAAAVQTLFESPAVDQVVAIWGSFLIYRGFEFASGEFGPNDPIPEVVLRGLDTPPPAPVDPSVLNAEHVPNQLIVTWKPEFVWNAAQTGFLQ